MSNDPERSDASQISTDRESIRAWAEEHDAVPFRDREEEAYRLTGEEQAGEAHEPADWDEFHSHLDDEEQVVIYHGETSDEPFEVTHREDALTRSNVSDEELEERLMEGDTVTSTVTETAVVEEVIVEEATIESELVDTEITDDRVIDAELVSRDVIDATLEETGTVDADEWFDTERYLSSVGQPGDAEWGEGIDPGATDRADTSDARATSTEPSPTEPITSDDPVDDEGSGTPVSEPVESQSTDADMMEGETTQPETTGAEMTGQGTDPTGMAPADRTYTDVDEEIPYTAHLDVEEAWSVTREVTERHTIESEVTDVEATEADSIEERDIDVEGLQQNLIESDMIAVERSPDELRDEGAIETEFTEDDRMETHFTRTRIVEDEVVDRQHLQAEITGAAERTDFERVSSMDVATESAEGMGAVGQGTTMTEQGETTAEGRGDRGPRADSDAAMGADEGMTTDADRNDEVMEDSAAMETASGSEVETGSGDIPLSQDEVGKDVVDASGETIGMVTDVSDDGTTMFVDAHPGITEKIKAALDWGEADDDDYPVEVEQIDHVTRDAITLKGSEELDELDSPAM